MENKYALAMYDIRGKQEFIYRSSRIKEIIGGSALIRDCFEDFISLIRKNLEKVFFITKKLRLLKVRLKNTWRKATLVRLSMMVVEISN